MKRVWVGMIGLLLVALFLLVPGAQAATFPGDTVVVIGPQETVTDDLYIFANTVIIQGHVQGDVYAFAQTVQIQGTVDGDVVVMGRVVDITGHVGDDVRAAALVIRIAGEGVEDDALLSGMSVDIGEDTPIGGDMFIAAYQARCAGMVQGETHISANAVKLAGIFAGDVDVNVGERQRGPSPLAFIPAGGPPIPQVSPGLTITRRTKIEGDLRYKAVEEAHIDPGAQIQGKVEHVVPLSLQRQKPEERRFGTRPWVFARLRHYISLLLVAVLLFLLVPGTVRGLAAAIRRYPAASLGWGIAAFLGFIASLFFLLLGSLILALIFKLLTLPTLSFWTLVLGIVGDLLLVVGYFAYVTLIVPILVPYAALSWGDRGGFWWVGPVVVGLILYILLTGLPYVGWLFNILFILIGLGALVLRWRRREPLSATTG